MPAIDWEVRLCASITMLRASDSTSSAHVGAAPHSRADTSSIAVRSPRSMSNASLRPMLKRLPSIGEARPEMRASPSRTSAKSLVNDTRMPGPGTANTATRSAGVSWSSSRSAARSAALPPPRRMWPWSTTNAISRPAPTDWLLATSGASSFTSATCGRWRSTNCTVTISRGWPSTLTPKSDAASPVTGRPSLSTTVTSAVTSDTSVV